MQIVKSDRYITQLRNILRFIALDSPSRARAFKKELNEMITLLGHFPYKYRVSIFFEHVKVRDMIFKGYVVPYLIDEDKNRIVVMGITKYKDSLI